MVKLILLRHGESEWNKRNLFTGWVDIPLSEGGVQEAIQAGKKMANEPIDIIFTSTLIRAQMTAMLAMVYHHSKKVPVILHKDNEKLGKWGHIHSEAAEAQTLPVVEAWELNERMYGDLQGLNKAETAAKFGAEQVKIWRRSFDIAPPNGESLKDTIERAIPYFTKKIVPCLDQGQNVLISAHGNSLRAISMHLDQLTPDQVVKLEIATGVPIIYDYHNGVFTKRSCLKEST